MSDQENIQPELRRKASELLRRLPPAERESLLVKCWMSHDARWFMAVALEHGIEAANRINQVAARGVGEAEAHRVSRALNLAPVKTLDDCLTAQEIFITLFGPDMLDYEVTKLGESEFCVRVNRCFAQENAERAGIAGGYECGIFARTGGWLKALGVEYEITPPLGLCLKLRGEDCIHDFRCKLDHRRGAFR